MKKCHPARKETCRYHACTTCMWDKECIYGNAGKCKVYYDDPSEQPEDDMCYWTPKKGLCYKDKTTLEGKGN